jgi:hypothetical protein
MKIYKYVTTERIDILETGLIRFTQPSVFNDPFEMSPYIEAIATDQFIDKKFNKEHEAHVLKAYNKRPFSFRWKIPFSTYYLGFEKSELVNKIKDTAKGAALNAARESIPSNIDAAVGVLSLTNRADNLLMWAHYADSHKGMVLEFDADHEFFNRRVIDPQSTLGLDADLRKEYGFLRPIKYDKVRPALTVSEIKDFSQLLVKSDDWAYEEEVRLLMPLPKAAKTISSGDRDNIHLFSIPPSAIARVIFGVKAKQALKNDVNKLIGSKKGCEHIQVDEMVLDIKEFKLETKSLLRGA